MSTDYDHNHNHNMEAVALRLILACLEESSHGLNTALAEVALDRGCLQCWLALIKALVAAAATGYELIDFAEAQASADPDYHLDPARAQAAAAIIANTLACSLDEPR
jgi:hypothetical protein